MMVSYRSGIRAVAAATVLLAGAACQKQDNGRQAGRGEQSGSAGSSQQQTSASQTSSSGSDQGSSAMKQAEDSSRQASDAEKKASEAHGDVASAQKDVQKSQQDLQKSRQKLQQKESEAQNAEQQAQQKTQQSQQQATARPSSSTTERTVQGRIVRAGQEEIVVRQGTGDKPDLRLKVGPDTTVTVGGRKRSVGDLQEGTQVRASYDESNGSPEATKIEAIGGGNQ